MTTGDVLWRQFVAYEHNVTWLTSNLPAEQTVGSDAFSFKVFDSHSNYSVPAVINITVVTGVLALSKEDLWKCYEDTDCDVRLFGSAIDDNDGSLSVTVTGVNGSFFDPVTNGFIEVGYTLSNIITYPYENGASVTYRSPTDFFTAPATEWNGTQLPPLSGSILISFYVSVELGSARISSTEVTQELKVVNVNDNSTIACEEGILQTQGSGIVDADLTFDYPRPDRLFIYNFSITEEDRGVDPIRVVVEVESGYLTLNETLKSRVSFELRCSGTRDWQCRGDGTNTRRMVFIGAPEDVQNVLNGMLFVSYERNEMDNMTVTIYDGFESDCIWEFSTSSLRPACFSSSCSILIDVGETWLGEYTEPLFVIHVYVVLVLLMLFSALMAPLVLRFLRLCKRVFCFFYRYGKHEQFEVRQAEQKGPEIVVDQITPTAVNTTSRRKPAKIPAGRTETKGAVDVHKLSLAKAKRWYSFWGLCVRRVDRGSSVAATEDMPRGHIEPSDELTWEETD